MILFFFPLYLFNCFDIIVSFKLSPKVANRLDPMIGDPDDEEPPMESNRALNPVVLLKRLSPNKISHYQNSSVPESNDSNDA